MVQGYTQEGCGISNGWNSFGASNFICQGSGKFTCFPEGMNNGLHIHQKNLSNQSETRTFMRDTFSRSTLNRSEDMSDDQKGRYIDYLADHVTNLDLDKRAMELVLEDFLKIQQEMQKANGCFTGRPAKQIKQQIHW